MRILVKTGILTSNVIKNYEWERKTQKDVKLLKLKFCSTILNEQEK